MNFAAQFFANFVKDGLQAQETRRSFSDSEEYDPFWQRESPAASQCPPESERSDVTGVADPLCSPSHPVLPPSTDSHSTLETPKPGPELTLRHQASSPSPSASPLPHPAPRKPSRSQAGASKRTDAPQPASKAPDPSPVEAADPCSSVALPPFPQLTENATLLSLLQALVYILLRLFLTFILLFLPR
ncbi:putative uncharacterized protein DDB_G0290521 [Sinocyclocheilus rhinocerous]|uniref:putative uncharacterized protein DDB_G0290521 n=1 Tax=Sinocyclocheilus rhinocerous TaxID=307959 RepID=UPI0007B8FBE6|nr:PREDICTED: putative uncharacterized protein DDB_G0290521 [Sinocyclocheilus rhinocerous]